MEKRYNNHTTAILVLIGATAALFLVLGCILWLSGGTVFSYTDEFASDMTRYDGTGLIDGYAVIADVFGVWASAFAAAFIYVFAVAAVLYTVWAVIFMILNWALRLSHVGCRVVNTVYLLPALAIGFTILCSGGLTNGSVGMCVILALYSGVILFLAYTSRVFPSDKKEEA